ncbi:MAG: hypothetical protein A2297_02125 [Elusimicrobia bacterium RIFOXYB2_FULL_48_7]|nr:MAG: hypothetical protein A2297_02125 [Elusimicrobia bacterium RIFOXYB2_FULL_48_7]
MAKKPAATCWKVQYYDISTLCWRTIPKTYTSLKLAEAVAIRLPVPRVRLVQAEVNGKNILLPEIKK